MICRLLLSQHQPNVATHPSSGPCSRCSPAELAKLGQVMVTGGLGSLGSLVAKWIMLSGSCVDEGVPTCGGPFHLVLAARTAHGSAAAPLLSGAQSCPLGCVGITSADLSTSEDSAGLLQPARRVRLQLDGFMCSLNISCTAAVSKYLCGSWLSIKRHAHGVWEWSLY